MSKAMRRQMVEELKGRLEDNNNFVLFDYGALTAEESSGLRKEFREANQQMNVVKNSIATIAFDQIGVKSLNDSMSNMNAVAYGKDPIAIARILLDYQEKTKKTQVRAAVIEGEAMSVDQLRPLADLPGRDGLLGMLLGVMQGVTVKFVSTLNEVPRKFVGTLEAVKEKQEG